MIDWVSGVLPFKHQHTVHDGDRSEHPGWRPYSVNAVGNGKPPACGSSRPACRCSEYTLPWPSIWLGVLLHPHFGVVTHNQVGF